MAQAQVEMAVAIAWAARAADAEAEAAWLRLQPSPEGGPQPSLGRTTWRATEAPRFARSEEVRATRTSVAFMHRLRKKKSVTVSVMESQFRRGPPAHHTPLTFTRFSPPQHTRCVAVYDIYKAGRSVSGVSTSSYFISCFAPGMWAASHPHRHILPRARDADRKRFHSERYRPPQGLI